MITGARHLFLLGLCEVGRADWLVTGNKDDLLALERYGTSQIVKAARLAEYPDISKLD